MQLFTFRISLPNYKIDTLPRQWKKALAKLLGIHCYKNRSFWFISCGLCENSY